MLAARELAGYTLSQADILRKAMGKKDPAVMAREESRFVEGAAAGGLEREVAQETFQQIAEFAGYGFNKSHAVGYALVAYVAGWLKRHFPVHFTASLLTAQQRSGDRDERIARTRAKAEAAGIPILPPDAQTSGADAEVEGGGVRYGLAAVKQMGERAARAIETARQRCGRFESLTHMLEEVEPGTLNRGSLEALTGAGALDCLGVDRSRIVGGIPRALRAASRARARRESGAQALFGGEDPTPRDHFPETAPWSDAERLERERAALGFYWSGHPGRDLRRAFPRAATEVSGLLEARKDREVSVVGLVRSLERRRTRDGRRMGKFQLEDDTGSIAVVVFPDNWAGAPELETEPAVLVRGALKGRNAASGAGAARGDGPEIIASEVLLASDALWRGIRCVEIEVSDPDAVAVALRDLLQEHRGNVRLDLRLRSEGVESLLTTAMPVAPNPSFGSAVVSLLGRPSLRVDGRPVPAFALAEPAATPDSAS